MKPKYFLFAKGVEQFDINKKNLGIGDDRAIYYAKSIGKQRIYRNSYPNPKDKGLILLTFSKKEAAQAEAIHANEIHFDNFEVKEITL